jgi:hypothetical protein
MPTFWPFFPIATYFLDSAVSPSVLESTSGYSSSGKKKKILEIPEPSSYPNFTLPGNFCRVDSAMSMDNPEMVLIPRTSSDGRIRNAVIVVAAVAAAAAAAAAAAVAEAVERI